jgi:hypothetical protein
MLMLGVAGNAIGAFGWTMLQRATHYESEAQLSRARASVLREGCVTAMDGIVDRQKLAEKLDGVAVKYERAGRRPWVALSPDPPEPRALRSN